MTNNLQLIRF